MKSETSSSKPNMSLADLKSEYRWVGSANSSSFNKPVGQWELAFVSASGNYEVYVDRAQRIYYDLYCD